MGTNAMTKGINIEPEGRRVNPVLTDPSFEHFLQDHIINTGWKYQHRQASLPDHDTAVLRNRSLGLWEIISCQIVKDFVAVPDKHIITVGELRVVWAGHGIEGSESRTVRQGERKRHETVCSKDICLR